MRHDQARQALEAIRRSLDQERRAAAALERARREQDLARSRDAELFRSAIKDAVPLPPATTRAERPRPLTAPPARPRTAGASAAADSGLSDGADSDHRVADGDATQPFLRAGVSPQTLRRLRRGEWNVDAQLDLHGRTRDQARAAVSRFLEAAAQSGWRCARIVHGKGFGSAGGASVLGPLTRRWLAQSDQVLVYVQAPDAEGGAGALLVLLRTGNRTSSTPSTQ